jgi:hypothetical protein
MEETIQDTDSVNDFLNRTPISQKIKARTENGITKVDVVVHACNSSTWKGEDSRI